MILGVISSVDTPRTFRPVHHSQAAAPRVNRQRAHERLCPAEHRWTALNARSFSLSK